MKIGVLGTGQVAHAIGSHWVRGGHDVLFGNRAGVAPDGDFPDGARFGALAAAAAHGEVVLLAIPGSAMKETVERLADTLAGKILFDCSNGLSPVDHRLELPDMSGAEEIAGWAPHARVVKVFNITGFENLADPVFAGEAATMFYATDDEAAGAVAHQLAAECGFDPVDAGPLAVARDLEWLTRFWGKLAFGRKLGRRIAFRLLRSA